VQGFGKAVHQRFKTVTYHVEMEIIINDNKEKTSGEEKIKKLAQELGIKLMTNEEVKNFAKKIEDSF
jgi:hypothetical protein